MAKSLKLLGLTLMAGLLTGCSPADWLNKTENQKENAIVEVAVEEKRENGEAIAIASSEEGFKRVDFSKAGGNFPFSAKCPASWQLGSAPEMNAAYLFDPNEKDGEKNPLLWISASQTPPENSANVIAYLTTAPSLHLSFTARADLPKEAIDSVLESVILHNAPESWQPPLNRPQERVTKKPFGLYVTPRRSPVQPEKFTGFHTGADWETFPEEANREVVVQAICGGPLRSKRIVPGYGGVALQDCLRGEVPYTILYGHLNIENLPVTGTYLAPGDTVGLLGQGGTTATGGERKHLHLGIIKGKSDRVEGYVQNKASLSAWQDPCQWVCGR